MEKPAIELGKVEYRVRKTERYVVTRYHEGVSGKTGGVDTKGEYENPDVAHEVAYALCRAEHELLGWPVGDERIRYPVRTVDETRLEWGRPVSLSGL